ncbi:hypothetical protein [Arthrobacter sp. zg-Y238]|uniref:hypothetical protein n=1 Tax=Arthrobacter sp. zg-Y238 TaxID=2964614 RepID=UPI002105FDAC|nr:hypothetical protein [Arthrobacter sp. zg-Y238]MCQ1954117.1 hypothetical protein [Arthrobacter sp. zg-Y238]
MKISVSPFYTPDPNSVVHSGWFFSRNGSGEALPEEMDSWDYQTVLSLQAEVTIDRPLILAQCRMGEGSQFRVVVKAKSDSTKADILLLDAAAPADANVSVPLQLDVPGTELGGRLTLTTFILVDASVPLDPLAPHQRGSILWKHSVHVYLQGIGAQFPTDAEDFRRTRPDTPDALWQLDADLSDPEASFASAVRLSMNTSQPAIRRLLQGLHTPENKQLQHLLDIDVTRQMAVLAVQSDTVLDRDPDHEDPSVAAVLRCLLQQLWPQISDPHILRKLWDSEPSKFEAHVQSTIGKLS